MKILIAFLIAFLILALIIGGLMSLINITQGHDKYISFHPDNSEADNILGYVLLGIFGGAAWISLAELIYMNMKKQEG